MSGTEKRGRATNSISISAGWRIRAALILAILADVVQLAIMPFFVEGAESPVDDFVDLGVAAVLVRLLGWRWEFLPSFAGKLLPGVDLVPFWTLAVVNVYRKSRRAIATEEASHPEERRERHVGSA